MGWVEAGDESGEVSWYVERLGRAQECVCVCVRKQVAETNTASCINKHAYITNKHIKNNYKEINTQKYSKVYLYENRHS